jgi:FkbM family methyltransferase
MVGIRGLVRRLAGGLRRRWDAMRVGRMLENPTDYAAAAAARPTGAPLRLRGGPALHYGPKDDPAYLFDELFLRDAYGLRSFYRPRPGDVILDIGGNIGWFALLCRYRAGGPIRIHSFEPEPQTRQRLLLNVQANGLASQVSVYPFAVSNRAGPATFSQAEHPLCRKLAAGGDLEVECVTLADALRLAGDPPRVDLLKMDIEGGEVEAIGSAGVAALAPVQRIVVEWHDRYRPGCLDACRSVLASAGFGRLHIEYEDARRDLGLLRAARKRGK